MFLDTSCFIVTVVGGTGRRPPSTKTANGVFGKTLSRSATKLCNNFDFPEPFVPSTTVTRPSSPTIPGNPESSRGTFTSTLGTDMSNSLLVAYYIDFCSDWIDTNQCDFPFRAYICLI